MGLVITTILLFYLISRLFCDGIDEIGWKIDRLDEKMILRSFEEEYYDYDLQKRVMDFQDQNPEAVKRELEVVSRQLKHWSANELCEYKSDIMMVNRGMIYTSRFGYWDLARMVLYGKDKKNPGLPEDVVREKGYELADWFQTTLNRQGKSARLYLLTLPSSESERFVWEGSFDYCQQLSRVKPNGVYGQRDPRDKLYKLEPFGRHLIEKKQEPISIPDPYYKN